MVRTAWMVARCALDRPTRQSPRAYTPELYHQKVGVLFEHAYESYQGEGRSVFNRVA
jgi:hypothetical protein